MCLVLAHQKFQLSYCLAHKHFATIHPFVVFKIKTLSKKKQAPFGAQIFQV